MITQNVVTPNAPALYMTGVQLVVARKVYTCPSIEIPDGFSIKVRASPLNAANVLIGPIGCMMTVDLADILRPGEWNSYFITNANLLQIYGFAANLVVNLSCEYGKR